MIKLTADFETTTDEKDCRVWAWAVCEIGQPNHFEYGNDIKTFIQYLYDQKRSKLWFHNLKFDGEFLVQALYKLGYTHVDDIEHAEDKTFTTLISNMGAWYSIDIFLEVDENKKIRRRATIYDSLKIFNFSVDAIAKDFALPINKLTLDYTTTREIGHELTPHEVDYIRNDVEIMARALDIMFSQGHTKMTIGSDALAYYKKITKNFRTIFPELPMEIDKDIRQSYKGGFTYLSPKWQNKIVNGGITIDINSAYPAVLHNKLLPYGYPLRFEGEYQQDDEYPLYVIMFSCCFELKKEKIPSIQLKRNPFFKNNEYLTSSNGRIINLCLTSPDYELFREQYNVKDLEFIGGYKFRATVGMFSDYVDYWIAEKIKNKKQGNKAQTLISKLFLNSLYGKFSLNVNSGTKIPLMVEGSLHYKYVPPDEKRKPVYLPIGTFTTAYQRKYIIETSQKIRDWSMANRGHDAYIYSDTDSCHLNLSPNDVPALAKFIKVDDYELGAWALECRWKRGKFLRQKCYIEETMEGDIECTVAGLPKQYAPLLNFDNFRVGFTTEELDKQRMRDLGIKPKLAYKHVEGGVVLQPTEFTIK